MTDKDNKAHCLWVTWDCMGKCFSQVFRQVLGQILEAGLAEVLHSSQLQRTMPREMLLREELEEEE